MHLLVTKGQTGRKSLKCLTKIIQTSKVSCFQDVVGGFFFNKIFKIFKKINPDPVEKKVHPDKYNNKNI